MTPTEETNPVSAEIDALVLEDIFRIMSDENIQVTDAVNSARDSILSAIQNAVSTFRSGGSLIYIGAGTSGRLGVLDASEIPPTFNVSPDLVRGIIAGGEKALTEAVEGAEDDEKAGAGTASTVTERDMLLGITASGTTPFTIAALKAGKKAGARCWLLTCNKVDYDFLDNMIYLPVGPEIIAGSTRLKAGTATKIVLNMISTASMIRLGKVYKGYMVDVVPSNNKLRARALKIIQEISGSTAVEAEILLDQSKGNAKTAILMRMKILGFAEANNLLKRSDGSLRKALQKGAIAGEAKKSE